jgi:nucleotide-binding universal stress UspA family protein
VPVLIERVTVDEGNGGACCRIAESSPLERVLVAVDLEQRPEKMVRFVLGLPDVSQVRVLHVVRDDEQVRAASERLNSALAGISSAEPLVLSGSSPADTIMKEADEWGATAIAMAPMARSVIHRALRGSVARHVALAAERSVLFVPASR